MGVQNMFKVETAKGTVAVMEGDRIGVDLTRLGSWINAPRNETIHYKNHKGQTFCLCCKNRVNLWTDSKSLLRRHPNGCEPIGHWPKGDD